MTARTQQSKINISIFTAWRASKKWNDCPYLPRKKIVHRRNDKFMFTISTSCVSYFVVRRFPISSDSIASWHHVRARVPRVWCVLLYMRVASLNQSLRSSHAAKHFVLSPTINRRSDEFQSLSFVRSHATSFAMHCLWQRFRLNIQTESHLNGLSRQSNKMGNIVADEHEHRACIRFHFFFTRQSNSHFV